MLDSISNGMSAESQEEKQKRFAMSLSLWVGLSMLAIKTTAYGMTGSSAILSDAAESVVHVIAVAFAAYSLRLASRPADEDHRYGFSKISFVSAGFEGGMIVIAALFILYEAITDWISGIEIQHLDWGLLLTLLALLINGALGAYLVWVGKKRSSLILEANGKHVLTDAWTSLGVLVGVALTWWTGWLPFDPICAIIVAVNILISGLGLMRRSVSGLLDAADPEISKTIEKTLEQAAEEFEIRYHQVRHLNDGNGYRIETHLLFDDDMTIQEAHRIATVVEERLHSAISMPIEVSTHLEPKIAHEKAHLHHH